MREGKWRLRRRGFWPAAEFGAIADIDLRPNGSNPLIVEKIEAREIVRI
jgi:hypothetical protein